MRPAFLCITDSLNLLSLCRCCAVCILSVNIFFSWQEMNSGVCERPQKPGTSAALQVEIHRSSWWDVEGVCHSGKHDKHWDYIEIKLRFFSSENDPSTHMRVSNCTLNYWDTKVCNQKSEISMYSNMSQMYSRLNEMSNTTIQNTPVSQSLTKMLF